MQVAILDCYVDEPACLGVPPYLSPYPRYVAGAVVDAGHEPFYLTIDDFRQRNGRWNGALDCDMLVVIAGALVPGKYLRSMPASAKEIRAIAEGVQGHALLGGPVARFGSAKDARLDGMFDLVSTLDLDAMAYDVLAGENAKPRSRTPREWKKWPVLGAGVAAAHPDASGPLIAELETYRGCVRQHMGGCSFCSEPGYGAPVFRDEADVAEEVRALSENGVRHFRLGAQTCIFSYKAKGVGLTETPTPDPEAVERLLKGIRLAAPELRVLHVDNANPAVIAEHPEEARKVAELLVRYCTPGNVVALGMESADPVVIRQNNLNATPEQVMDAIRLLNEVGGGRGENGLPSLLPGLNFLGGLEGETKATYEASMDFLRKVLGEGLLVRRINIRQVRGPGTRFDTRKHHRDFVKFKQAVRKDIDGPMLERLVPAGTVLKDIYLEMLLGKVTYGRQVGSYPLLVGVPYEMGLDRFVDVVVTSHGQRSVTGVEYPFMVNEVPYRALEALPGVGKRRAMRLFRGRPYSSFRELEKVLDSRDVARGLENIILLD